jgi:hypothetical protein
MREGSRVIWPRCYVIQIDRENGQCCGGHVCSTSSSLKEVGRGKHMEGFDSTVRHTKAKKEYRCRLGREHGGYDTLEEFDTAFSKVCSSILSCLNFWLISTL